MSLRFTTEQLAGFRRDAQLLIERAVEDDQDHARDLLAIVLENAGFSVRTATNGLDALITAHDMRPGVIVMDVSMPVLDGLEATRLLTRPATPGAVLATVQHAAAS